MTRLLRRRTDGTESRRGYRGKHRAPAAPRRHRWRRRAPYAAAGLLALTGAMSHNLSRPHGRTVAPRPVARTNAAYPIRPAAVRPAPLRVVAVPRPPARASRGRTVRVGGAVHRGRATWYGPGFAGRRTASGEVFQPYTELTAAHRWLPFGTRLNVCRRDRCVVVRVNDRGPFGDAILDLSYLAAERLGMVRAGIVTVTATVL